MCILLNWQICYNGNLKHAVKWKTALTVIKILRFIFDIFTLEFFSKWKDSKMMSASTTDVAADVHIGDVKCDMLEVIDRIFNNVLRLHLSYQVWYI